MNAKKLVAGCTAMLLLTGNVFGVSTWTHADTVQRAFTMEAEDAVKMEAADAYEVRVQAHFYEVNDFEESAGRIAAKAADSNYSLSDSAWAGSGSDYYFSHLNAAEKKLYIELKKQADSYLTGMEDFETTEVKRGDQKAQVYILPLLSYDGLTAQQMKKVFLCFNFENPQYYFLRNSVAYSENTKMMAVGLNENFASGEKRAEYTAQLAQQLSVWEELLTPLEKTVEKERKIHELICQHVSYDDNMDADDPDDKEMSQSCISAVLFKQSAVCTGYAQLFALLCNRAGIPCVTVTSESHAWNKVRVGGVWYNTDCTWNDARGDDVYLNVTDEQIKVEDTEKAEHTASAEWEGIAPACADPFNARLTKEEDNSLNHVNAPDKMGDITALSQKGKLTVQFELASGCDGYMVQYAANAAMEQANKKNVEKTPCVISGLKEGKAYYVRVRAYNLDSNGNKLYGAYSNKVKVIIKQ